MKRVLLLGGSGFIGTNLAFRLDRVGHAVTVGTRRPGAVKPIFADTRIAVAGTDYADLAAVEAILADHDTVILLACSLGPSSSPADRIAERSRVLAPAVGLMRILARRGVGLVYFSSGGTVYGEHVAERARESDPCRPISPYGLSKLEGESDVLNSGRNEGLRYLILRPSNAYGPGQPLDGRQGLVSAILGKLIRGEALQIWGSGAAVRDYIHVDDLTGAVEVLVARGAENCILNLGSGFGHSVLEVVAMVEEIAGRKIPLEFRPARAVDVTRVVLDVSAVQRFGVDPPRSLQDGIRDYMRARGLADG